MEPGFPTNCRWKSHRLPTRALMATKGRDAVGF
jgi:hypothetical protein